MFVPILALLSLVFWGLSSPAGSSPDDDFHLASIWCGAGERADICTQPDDKPDQRTVPQALLGGSCYAMKPAESAACQGRDFGTDPQKTMTTDRVNLPGGLYPPVYYAAMSVFVGSNVEVSVLVMRIVNSLIFVALLTSLYLLLPWHRRSTLVWATAITMVPFGMFLVPSTNPSGWAVLSASALWIALLGYFESSGRKRAGLAVVAALATVIGAGARADSAAYAGLAIIAAVILAFRRDRKFLLQCILPLVLAAICAFLYLSAGQSDAAPSAGGIDWGVAVTNLLGVPSLWTGAFGGWNLGWLDTALPPLVWVVTFGIFCGFLLLGLGIRHRRKGIVAALVFAALWLVPTFVLTQAKVLVGSFVQPRYILPLILILGGIALLQHRSAFLPPSRIQLVVTVVGLSLANAIALHTNLRRYVTGAEVGGWNLDARVEWWWNLPFSPMFVWIAGSLAFAAMLVLMTAVWNPEGRVRFANRPEPMTVDTLAG
ncbi:MAG TPA: DUF2142 domain-containing protein [Lacisediminihabitans sp.]|uniref:DUF2142 domain-containing protein n=1 Tax=Lacisediminihabitans sp. TaxID=2787631 RepID=UPI002ED9AAD4